MKRRALAPALVVAVMHTASSSHANGAFETYGVDPRSKGMANSVTGLVAGPAAAHYNPAGIARTSEPEVMAAFSLSLPDVTFEMERAGAAAPSRPSSFVGSTLLGATSLGPGFGDRLFVGVALYQPTFNYTHSRAPDPTVPFAYLYDSYTDHFELSPVVALKWFDWFSTGIGMRVGAAQTGNISLAIDPLRNRITRQSIDAEQIPFSTPTAGLTLGPLGIEGIFHAALGLAYREHLSLPMGIVTAVEVEGTGATVTMPVHIVANYSPRTFTGGLGVDLFDMIELGLDVQYALWSEAPTPYLAVETYVHGEGVEQLGLGGAIDAPAPGQARIAPAGFVDTVNVRLGGEARFFDELAALRAGYMYRPTPVPDQTSGTNIGDANAHVVAAGAGLAVPLPILFARPLRFDLSWQTALLVPRRADKRSVDDPTGSWVMRGTVSELAVAISYRW